MGRRILIAGIYLTMILLPACSDKTPQPTGLPGDNLDLYAVLDLFKSSSTIEGFEKSLNDPSNKVNNLDLNGDGKVDYICVVDQKDSNAHAITLRVAVAPDEFQDAAVIVIEKTGDKTAGVQVIGDEDIYGKDFIVEPKKGNDQAGFIYVSEPAEVNVWLWPVVTYVYEPAYVVYVSPYHYDYYPVLWTAWEPVTYEVYYPMVFKNHGQYVSYNKHRFKHADEIYYPYHRSSVFVLGRVKNGEFKGGKQEHYKGHDFPKGNNKHDGGNMKNENGMGAQHDKDNHHDGAKMNGNEKKGNDPKNGNNQKVQDHSQKQTSGSSQKQAAPKNSGSKQKGGSSPKGGKSPKGGGGKHK
ncbi:hypothetical protein BH09BAC5_BH09BAC5_16460 [soil metagenome]